VRRVLFFYVYFSRLVMVSFGVGGGIFGVLGGEVDITLTAHQHALESTLKLRGGGVLIWIPIRSLVARLWNMKAFHSLAVRIRGHERLSFYASTKITAEHSSLMSLSRFLSRASYIVTAHYALTNIKLPFIQFPIQQDPPLTISISITTHIPSQNQQT